MNRINPSDWQTHKVRGRVYEVMTSVRGETVVLGAPPSEEEENKIPEDERHNCDANGCGQDHVLWRGKAVSP